MKRIFPIAAGALLLSLPSWAQTSHYSTWSNPDQSGAAPPQTATPAPVQDPRLQDFTDKLNKLVDETERARAADPNFLRDLRDLARSAGSSTAGGMKLVASNDFADGDFTQNPAWTVTQGEYFIENGWGLRNKAQQAGQQGNQNLSNEEKAMALFGAP
ncbi:MAG: hypothetical protein VW268_11790 [Rhodospirillaceae bacterium]